MVRFTDLNELNLALKVIDNLLIALMAPPLNREVHFPARRHQPKGLASILIAKLGEPRLLLLRDMDVTMKSGRLNLDSKSLA